MNRICYAIALAALLCSPFVRAGVNGGSPLYSPSSAAPKPGSLYPRALQLRHAGRLNGVMLATFEKYVDGKPSFPIYRSTDNGRSWSFYTSVEDTRNGWGLRYQPFLYELPRALGAMPAGTILCFGNSIPRDLSQTRLDMYKSIDHGASWTFVSHVAHGGAANPDGTQDPIWEPFAIFANGKLIVFYSDERDPKHNQKIVHQATKDGFIWEGVVDDVALPLKQRPGMPVIAKMGNSGYIMAWECICDGTSYTAVKTSSNPEVWNVADIGTKISNSGGTPYIVWMSSGGVNGSLVLSVAGKDDIYINRSYGAPGSSWIRTAAIVGGGYSRSFVVLSDNKTLFEISPVSQPNGYNKILYGTQLIKGDPLHTDAESADAHSLFRPKKSSTKLKLVRLSLCR